jgi:nitroreductase
MNKNGKLFRILRALKGLSVNSLGVLKYYSYDYLDYVRNSSAISGLSDREALTATVTVMTHNIEKGLALPAPRVGYGLRNLEPLVQRCNEYIARYGADDTIARAQGVLEAYVRFNLEHENENYPLRREIADLLSVPTQNVRGGVKTLLRSEVLAVTETVSPEFFESRSSVRIFDPEPIADEKIISALRVAQKAPGVCNRQSGYVYVLRDEKDIRDALAIQGGANGFSDNVPTLLVITTRTKNFFGPERNQRWVDGGLFAMSLILGLHREGLATCCLNWSKPGSDDRKLKNRLSIPSDRSIIFLLAVGNMPQSVKVARSEKRPVADMCEFR